MAFNVVQVANPRPKIITTKIIENFDALNTNALYQLFDRSKYGKIELLLTNLTDVDLTIHIRYSGDNRAHKTFNGSDWVNQDNTIIPGKTGDMYCLNTVFPYLNEMTTDKMGIRIQAKAVATNGGLVNVILKGEEL